MKLNQAQQQAVSKSLDVNLRIIAGPGTGKTTVLIERLIYLFKKKLLLPQQTLALTFTRKAAQKLKTQLRDSLPNLQGPFNVFTYHAFCLFFLQREWKYLSGKSADLQVIDQVDQKAILKLLLNDLPADQQINIDSGVVAQIQEWVGILQVNFIENQADYQQALINKNFDFPTLPEQQKLLWNIFQRYTIYKKEENLLDFNDLLMITYQSLRDHSALLTKWQRRFHHIAIDEFQDTSEVQYRIIALLTDYGKKTTVTIIGDPDQTIYGWRNAQIKFILELDQKFTNVETVYLEQNYRSNNCIVIAANHLIQYNHQRLPKQLVTATKLPSQALQIHSLNSRYQQTRLIVRQIQKLLKNQTKPESIAVLYRANWLAVFLETELLANQISYFIYKGMRFFVRQEIKGILTILGFLATQDDFYFRTILLWTPYLGSKILKKIEIAAENAQQSLFTFLAQQPRPNFLKRFDATFQKRYEQIQNWQTQTAKGSNLADLVDTIIQDYFREYLSQFPDFDRRWKNVMALLEIVKSFDKQNTTKNVTERVQKFLNDTKVYTADDLENAQNVVQLMTAHNAKGLEFDHVFLFDVTDRVFPAAQTLEIEEERRLFFVALTRARRTLVLTGDQFEESIFLTELSKLPAKIVRQFYND